MHITLAAIEPGLAEAWEQWFKDLPDVEIHRGSILDLDVDAVVSPANSFGFMDGGIDWQYTQRFGTIVQERLQQAIGCNFGGELVVGTAERIGTDDPRIPSVISAPTMRVPSVLINSVNPYLATRAALRVAQEHGLDSIAFPGMGTGVGCVPFKVCAKQMFQAVVDVLHGSAFPGTWREARRRQEWLVAEEKG